MSEQENRAHESVRPQEESRRTNASLIWRRREAPVSGADRAAEDRAFIRRAMIGSLLALLLLCAAGAVFLKNFNAIRSAYAGTLIRAGSYAHAERVLEKLPDGERKQTLQKENDAARASALEAQGDLAHAAQYYLAAGDASGALDGWRRTTYALGEQCELDGDFAEAQQAFDSLGDYLDAPGRADECGYAYAKERLEYGFYDEAMRLFYALGSYRDAAEYAAKAAEALEQNEGAGDLVSLLVGLSEEQLSARAALKTARDALPKGILATGYLHTAALKEDGTVLATGSNLSGQCKVETWQNVVSVAAGAYHTAALLSDGTVVACGSNKYGQCDVGSWKDVVALCAGAYNTVGITSDGRVLVAGYAAYNTAKWRDVQILAVGDYALLGVMRNGQPLSTSPELLTGQFIDLVQIDAASANSAGLKADGTVVTNGLDASGLDHVLAIDCTENGLFALLENGRVEARFYNANDALDVSGWQNVVAISASATHVVGVTADGRVLAAGWKAKGQCDVADWVLFTPAPTPSTTAVPTPEP